VALVKGVNCGFVSEPPSGDPGGTHWEMDGRSIAIKDTSPENAVRVIEIGWYCANDSEDGDYEVGIYEHNVGDNNPEALVGKSDPTAKGTLAGWKRVTGLNIPITAETIYWIAVQLDEVTGQADKVSASGERTCVKNVETELLNPWGENDSIFSEIQGFYAVYETGPPPPTIQDVYDKVVALETVANEINSKLSEAITG
jgi:hypothetical protein